MNQYGSAHLLCFEVEINLAVLVMSGVFTGVLASMYGAVGAASATTVVEVLYTGMLATAVMRTGARPRISLAGMSRAVLSALIGGLALVPPHLPAVVRPVLALSVYCVCLLVFGAVPREILDQIPRPRRSLP